MSESDVISRVSESRENPTTVGCQESDVSPRTVTEDFHIVGVQRPGGCEAWSREALIP